MFIVFFEAFVFFPSGRRCLLFTFFLVIFLPQIMKLEAIIHLLLMLFAALMHVVFTHSCTAGKTHKSKRKENESPFEKQTDKTYTDHAFYVFIVSNRLFFCLFF